MTIHYFDFLDYHLFISWIFSEVYTKLMLNLWINFLQLQTINDHRLMQLKLRKQSRENNVYNHPKRGETKEKRKQPIQSNVYDIMTTLKKVNPVETSNYWVIKLSTKVLMNKHYLNFLDYRLFFFFSWIYF